MILEKYSHTILCEIHCSMAAKSSTKYNIMKSFVFATQGVMDYTQVYDGADKEILTIAVCYSTDVMELFLEHDFYFRHSFNR